MSELETEAEDTNPSLDTSTHEAAERDHILRALRDAKGLIAGDTGAALRLGQTHHTIFKNEEARD